MANVSIWEHMKTALSFNSEIYGSKLNERDDEGMTPLMVAASKADKLFLSILDACSKEHLEAVNAKQKNQSVLHYAMATNEVEIATNLMAKMIELGCNLEPKDADGKIPSDLADKGFVEFVSKYAHGISRVNKGQSRVSKQEALGLINGGRSNGHFVVMHPSPMPPKVVTIFEVIDQGNLPTITEYNALKRRHPNTGHTPLMYAAWKGNQKFLLEYCKLAKKEDFDAVNEKDLNKTALHYLAEHAFPEVLTQFLGSMKKVKAEMSKQDVYDNTPVDTFVKKHAKALDVLEKFLPIFTEFGAKFACELQPGQYAFQTGNELYLFYPLPFTKKVSPDIFERRVQLAAAKKIEKWIKECMATGKAVQLDIILKHHADRLKNEKPSYLLEALKNGCKPQILALFEKYFPEMFINSTSKQINVEPKEFKADVKSYGKEFVSVAKSLSLSIAVIAGKFEWEDVLKTNDSVQIQAYFKDNVSKLKERNYEGLTPLMYASKKGLTGCIDGIIFICDKEALEMTNPHDGCTALHYAILANQGEIGFYIYGKMHDTKANFFIKNKLQKTPVDLICTTQGLNPLFMSILKEIFRRHPECRNSIPDHIMKFIFALLQTQASLKL